MKKDDQNISLDDMIVKEGVEFNPAEEAIVEKTNFSYEDDDIILPGKKVNMPISTDVQMEKEKAKEHLVKQLAFDKLAKEKEAFNKLSETEKIKDYIFRTEYYRSTNEFYTKYGYEMSGSQKRSIKRAFERAWKKGKYKLTEEQKQDILYELNKASNQINNYQAEKPAKATPTLSTLNELMYKE